MPTVSVFEAVALSLNVDPRVLRPHLPKGATSGVPISRIPPAEIYPRHNLAMRCIGETLPAAKPRYGEEHVYLKHFGVWADANGWSLPDALWEITGALPARSRRATIAAEKQCQDWLVDQMRQGPPSKNRNEYMAEAMRLFSVGVNAFTRAWRNATKEADTPGWGKPGPKSKH